MIQLENIAKGYGGRILFRQVNWSIGPKDRVGLVGPNGSGKSTLLRLIAGLDEPDAGRIIRPRSLKIGYLPQQGLELHGKTVFEECATAFEDLQEIEAELAELARQLSQLDPTSPAYARASHRFHELETVFHSRSGYALEARIGAVLAGLGFPERDWHRPVEQFSGGWQMRIALAKLLLAEPAFLLLDEPTNHLDLEARNWFEQYLESYPHAFVLVSHDRRLLDRVVTRIAEIDLQHLNLYSGNYSSYLEQKQKRREQLEAAWKHQQQHIRHLEEFINRFRYKASHARVVQSRIKELERIERIELPPQLPTLQFRFPQPPPSGRVVAVLQRVSKAYDAHVVFRDASFSIERGDKIALVGPNGAGKSTLLKLLAGLEQPTSGSVKLGERVQPSYFAQDQYRELPEDRTLLEDLSSVAANWTVTQVRTLLGCFLFSEDDVYKPIRVLSGGERNRYALARLIVSPANFLLLDEPTNHLDLNAKEVLLQALKQYTGTVVFVSHDRYFIDELATKVVHLHDGLVEVYLGNYEDFLRAREQRTQMNPPPVATPAQPVRKDPLPAAAPEGAPRRRTRMNPLQLARLKQQCEQLEAEISQLEEEIRQEELALAHFESVERTRQLLDSLESKRQRLEQLMNEWEIVATRVVEAEQQQS